MGKMRWNTKNKHHKNIKTGKQQHFWRLVEQIQLVSAIRKLIEVSASRASRLQIFVDTHTYTHTHAGKAPSWMRVVRPHSQWKLFVYRYTLTHTRTYYSIYTYATCLILCEKKWAHQTGFIVKNPDTKTKYNRLKNEADNTVRRWGECLCRKDKMAAQHFVYLCVRLCTCVCAWTADSQNRQDEKM